MAGSINKVILVGNTGSDPEIRTMGNGGKVCNFTIATSEKWKDKQSGEQREKTEWHKVVIFNENLVRVCENYVKKGDKLYLEGALQTRKWQDRDGNDKYTTEVVLQKYRGEIVLLGGKSDQSKSRNDPAKQEPEQDLDLDDDIPF